MKLLFIVFLLILTITNPSYARTLPQLQKPNNKPVQTAIKTGVGIFPRLRSDRRAIIINFTGLQNASFISFNLTYLTNGRQEGAGGSITPQGEVSTLRELLFGTCSKNDCTYHQNITNMKLEVTTQLTSGKKFVKRYRIKI